MDLYCNITFLAVVRVFVVVFYIIIILYIYSALQQFVFATQNSLAWPDLYQNFSIEMLLD